MNSLLLAIGVLQKTMENSQNNLDDLLQQLERLIVKQRVFSIEVDALKKEIHRLKSLAIEGETKKVISRPDTALSEKEPEIINEEITPAKEVHKMEGVIEAPKKAAKKTAKSSKSKTDLEKFIGENLINKIGIAITVIGVAIGTKYSIEHDLISPLTRIILGYLMGLGLLAVGIKLKQKYTDYSAVLISGAMVIMYFITFSAYSFYNLIPQTVAFAFMVLFTIFTVVAALNYNRQVIAIIGLVGAYAVPFLLSENSGRVDILFSYIAILNIGILIIAFKKYWKSLFYSSFALTWIIYFFWFFTDYETETHFTLALTFLAIFFVIFYTTFLAYKLLQKEKFAKNDILLLLLNSFIFYGLGYALLDGHEKGEQLLGLFTLGNAIVHFIISVVVYRKKLADRNLFYLISGLVLLFITIAIPVQLDGNWVTLLWAGEATLLFWIGRTKNVAVYEKLSYPLIFLAFFSLLHDWMTAYDRYLPEDIESKITPILNIHFLSSALFIAAFGFINYLLFNKKYPAPFAHKKGFVSLMAFIIPAIFLFVIYYAFKIEIDSYFNQLYLDSAVVITDNDTLKYNNYHYNYDIRKFNTIWDINYTLLFFTILSIVNIKKIKSQSLGIINLIFNAIAILIFLTVGLYTLSELRESYLAQTLAQYYKQGTFHIGIRYVSFAFVAALLVTCYHYIRQEFIKTNFTIAFTLLLHISILWVASSELINWMDIGNSNQSYKLGLSILWGIYSLLLIVLGIWKKRKYLRVGAIILFGITLIKLFFYDIAHLNTIAKTIVFVSLGVLLLIISFLYNKYKHNISDEAEN